MNLLRTFSLMSGLTLLSRILGFMRDMLVANYFGASLITDAYFVAFRLPNTLRRLFAEGAFTQAFVPTLAHIRSTQGTEAARQFSRRMLTFLMLATACFSCLGILYAEPLIRLTAQGFQQKEQIHLAASLLRIMAIYLFLIAIAAFFSGILNTWQHFFTPALTPIVFNVCLIGTLFLYRPQQTFTIYALAWGVVIAGICQVLIQVYPLWRRQLFPWPHWQCSTPAVISTIRKMGPALLGVSVAQISLLINTAVASFLPKGAITWIYLADRLMEMPIGLVGASIATVLLPALASQTRQDHLSTQLNGGIGLACLLTIPASIGLATLGPAIIGTLFFHGSFTVHDVTETTYALNGYLIGLLPLVLTKILAAAFYARNDMKTPIQAAISALVITQILNFSWYSHLAQMGITLAISIGAWTNTLYLWYALIRTQRYTITESLRRLMIRGLCASLCMGALGLLWRYAIHWTSIPLSQRALYLCLSGTSCLLVYVICLKLLGVRPADISWRREGIHEEQQLSSAPNAKH